MELIGRYEPLQILGEGVVGRVFSAREIGKRGEQLAIKVVHQRYLWDEALLGGFRQSWEAQRDCRHKHIVEAIEFLDEGAFVMRYVHGPSLASVMAASGSLPVDVSVSLMSQIASAVGFAHGKGVLHYDLKPSNVLVLAHEAEWLAKVGDFGVARNLKGSIARKATGARVGSLAYQSPEHLQAPGSVDERSDIYSLGTILYEMLAGCPPFAGFSEYSLMSAIVEQAPSPPSEVVGGACGEFDDLVLRALAKNPAKRFESCGELKEALRSRLSITRTHVHSMAMPLSASVTSEPGGAERAAELVREARLRANEGNFVAARGRARRALVLHADCEEAEEILHEIEEIELQQRASARSEQLADAARLVQVLLRDRGPQRARRILHQAVESLGAAPELDELGATIDRVEDELRRSEVARQATKAADRERRARIAAVVARVDKLIATRSLLIAAEELEAAIRLDGRVDELDELALELSAALMSRSGELDRENESGKARAIRELARELCTKSGPDASADRGSS